MAESQKTGRNLQVATTVGLARFGLLVGSLYFNPVFYARLAAVFAGFASREVFSCNIDNCSNHLLCWS